LELKIITPEELYTMTLKSIGEYDAKAVKQELRLKYMEEDL